MTKMQAACISYYPSFSQTGIYSIIIFILYSLPSNLPVFCKYWNSELANTLRTQWLHLTHLYLSLWNIIFACRSSRSQMFFKLYLFIYLFIYLFYFIYFFNSFFTVDFPMVITTNLHRLTENFIIKRKILKHFKSSHQRCIQNPVKAGDGNSLENRQPLHAVNYFLKKLHRNLIAP